MLRSRDNNSTPIPLINMADADWGDSGWSTPASMSFAGAPVSISATAAPAPPPPATASESALPKAAPVPAPASKKARKAELRAAAKAERKAQHLRKKAAKMPERSGEGAQQLEAERKSDRPKKNSVEARNQERVRRLTGARFRQLNEALCVDSYFPHLLAALTCRRYFAIQSAYRSQSARKRRFACCCGSSLLLHGVLLAQRRCDLGTDTSETSTRARGRAGCRCSAAPTERRRSRRTTAGFAPRRRAGARIRSSGSLGGWRRAG